MLPLLLLSLFTLANAAPQATTSSDCVGNISSLDDVDDAIKCTTVIIQGFTVPGGKTFSLNLLQGTTVHVVGDIQFGNMSWSGPLFYMQGEDITFKGNKKTWDGGGPWYWDGDGQYSVAAKPDPMMSIKISGTMSDVHLVNSPERGFAIDSTGPLTITGAVLDDSQGNSPNDKSNGLPAGRNTDGFDVCGNDIVIKNSVVINQDDCLAINQGKNITFEDNYCDGGHGISIGSISSDVVVENVVFQGNTIVNSEQAFRIKTEKSATNSRVSNISYSDNTATNCTSYGVIVTQSYPQLDSEPGNDVIISNISFSPVTTDITLASDAEAIILNCGAGSCTGEWNLSGLRTSGGKAGTLKNAPQVEGYSL